MERFGGGGGDTLQLDSNSSGGAVFDASQYAFFGNEVLEEIELGGLEDDGDLLEAKFEDDEHLLEQEEGVFPGIDDLSTTFLKLNKDGMGPSVGGFGDRGSRETSSAADWAQGGDYTNWVLDQDNFEAERGQQQTNKWSNASFPLQDPSTLLHRTSSYESNQYLHRTSSYPEQHQQHNLNQHLIDESKNLHRTSSYPMLAARVTIEDGICLLLDVDDIDRFLQFNQLQDGGAQLRQRRQVLLEGLATSLQLVDPFSKNGQTDESAQKDDFIFLRLVSLSKGRKLISSYLNILTGKRVDSCGLHDNFPPFKVFIWSCSC
ncbi:hypothetical protein HanIR_Chr11g0520011 [Helianthus annuus]|nr:hypothetical protein HanIR_Chr11g0520011 [Helianthus annuus]